MVVVDDVDAVALLVLPLEESECCMGVRLDSVDVDGADMGWPGRWWWLEGGYANMLCGEIGVPPEEEEDAVGVSRWDGRVGMVSW